MSETPPDFKKTRRQRPDFVDLAKIDRLPPHSVEAEQGALGCVLLDPNETVHRCAVVAPPESFYDLRHQTLAQALYAMSAERVPIDLITVSQYLRDKHQLDAIGGMAYLSELQNATPSAANLSYYLGIIRKKHAQRRIISSCTEMVARVYETPDIEAVSLLDVVDKEVRAFSDGDRNRQGAESLAEIAKESVARWEDAASGKPQKGIPFLMPGLGHLINWADGHRLFVIGARPSVGKTSVILHFADEAAKLGHSVGLVSMEMPSSEIFDRLVARETGIPYRRIAKSDTNERERALIAAVLPRVKALPVHIIPWALTLPQLEAEMRRMIQRNGIKALFVDYLGLIKKIGKMSLYEHITEVSQALKGLAMRTGIPIICAAQLNRETDNVGREPQLSDFRDSGSIEQDADVALLLSEKSDRPRELTINVAKQRGGERGKVQVQFDRATCRFSLTT